MLLLKKKSFLSFKFFIDHITVHAFVLSWLRSLCLMRCWVECPLDLKKLFYYLRYQSKFTCFTVCLCIFQNYSSLDVYPLQLIKSIEVQGPDKLRRVVLDAPSTVCPLLTTIFPIWLCSSFHPLTVIWLHASCIGTYT